MSALFRNSDSVIHFLLFIVILSVHGAFILSINVHAQKNEPEEFVSRKKKVLYFKIMKRDEIILERNHEIFSTGAKNSSYENVSIN